MSLNTGVFAGLKVIDCARSFAIPKEFRFLPVLPKTSAGKLDKKKIRTRVAHSSYSQM